jgi:hypothetical protein
VSADELERARLPLLTSLRESLRMNGYWLNSVLARAQEKPEVSIGLRTRLADTEAITTDETQRARAEISPPRSRLAGDDIADERTKAAAAADRAAGPEVNGWRAAFAPSLQHDRFGDAGARRLFRLVLLALARALLSETQRTDTWFRHYTENFRTVELNAPIYSWPKLATAKGGRGAHGRLPLFGEGEPTSSRTRADVHTRMLVEEFYRFAEILGPKLGCFCFNFRELPLHRASRSTASCAAARAAIPEPVCSGPELVA